MDWYICSVEIGKEDNVRESIANNKTLNDISCIVPKRIVPEKKGGEHIQVTKLIFPGYIFIKTTMNFSKYHQICQEKHIIKMLGYNGRGLVQKINNLYVLENSCFVSKINDTEFQDSFFQKIPNEEMIQLFKLLNENQEINFSHISVNDKKIVFEKGPLKGLENLVKKIDLHKKRAKVCLHLLGIDVLFDVGIRFFQ
ncbi:antiterminator LoaP [Paenibacillus sp. NPDC057934]|uniref:antiterminator LoaP n=1 Tax=Paenibacillus sp. NPDC057934 TaxID=3346282 RepID=UPI0036DDDC68